MIVVIILLSQDAKHHLLNSVVEDSEDGIGINFPELYR